MRNPELLPVSPFVEVIIRDERINVGTFTFMKQGSVNSAGYDMVACIEQEEQVISPGATILIDTGISIFVKDPAFVAKLYPRSSLGHKHGIVLGNLTGIIDADYEGNLMVSLWNRSDKPYTIKAGERIAQLTFEHVVKPVFTVVDKFSEQTERGHGAFGHSGKH